MDVTGVWNNVRQRTNGRASALPFVVSDNVRWRTRTMAQRNYLVDGLSGTGKSSVYDELLRLAD